MVNKKAPPTLCIWRYINKLHLQLPFVITILTLGLQTLWWHYNISMIILLEFCWNVSVYVHLIDLSFDSVSN